MIIFQVQQIQVQEITQLIYSSGKAIYYTREFVYLLFKNTLRSVIELTIYDLCR